MIRIVIAEKQPMMLGALGSLINLEEDMVVVGKASNGEEAISLIQQLQPDICIIDNEMHNKSAMEVAEELNGQSCKIIILTTFARSGFVQQAKKVNVKGYFLKDNPSQELANSIRLIHSGSLIFAPEPTNGENQETIPNDPKLEVMTNKRNVLRSSDKSKYIRNYFSLLLDKIEIPNRKKMLKQSHKKDWFK
ncbi:response regulator [Lederbergia lenta]|uniref:Two-component response regulator DesR n=1 Tax=Lederbergia lenta TaxID=1467 RepID=A0A2X4ZDG2_LEDLE|nr:response regulator transcription factor [Lederbergia lenta]MCM3109542.1 response regulator transcription factor [Lederbergia lenta]MEC2324704.1 response regulator transcription factor [Lederbergia lenta]SQI58514.1 two-component response regulator DesR [Lederbergia lenta]